MQPIVNACNFKERLIMDIMGLVLLSGFSRLQHIYIYISDIIGSALLCIQKRKSSTYGR